MPRLTWDNVTGFNTNAGSESLRSAGSLFGKAFEGFSKTAEKKQDELVQQNTAAAIDELRSLNTLEDFDSRQEEFSVDRLTRRFGEGNFNAEAVSKLRDTARQEIVNQMNAEEDRKNKLEDRDRRIRQQNFDYNVAARNDAEEQNAKEALDIATKSFQTNDVLARNQAAAVQKGYEQYIKENPQAANKLRVVNGQLKVVEKSGATSKDVEKATQYIMAAGYKSAPTKNERAQQLREKLRSYKNKDGSQRFRDATIDQIAQGFLDRVTDAKLSKDAESKIAAYNSGIDKNLKDSLDVLNANEKDMLDALNEVKDPDERAKQVTELNTYINKLFPESHYNFLGIGSQEGGTALTEGIAEILKKPGVEPWMVYYVLPQAADYEDHWWDAKSVSLGKLEDGINELIEKENTGVSNTVEQRKAVRNAALARRQTLEAGATADKSAFKLQKEVQERIYAVNYAEKAGTKAIADALRRLESQRKNK